MQHVVLDMIVYLQKYVYIVQLQITNAHSSSVSVHLSHSRSHEIFFLHEIWYGTGERIR